MITYMNSNALAVLKSTVEANLTTTELALARDLEARFQAAVYQKELGLKIKARRVTIGLSQRELAKTLGISQREICHLEQGKANPTLLTQIKILSALDLKIKISAK